ncbi:phosphotransferase family protein [Rhodococcoides fascians]|uniref:Putative aminoglycoside phosphotransferase n=1 Tax=Rhodococcoides fascians TaxID=1828 RepID=A0A143QNA0_RHOFA|nr:phosphotransferase family protein [Rhodococcus fascians]AMY24286.1 Putative aminoglycoside phosphotransferase [Rhodococcus fascians]KMJ48592.1 acyl-CoA dehydrogenase [Rhodococcus fascians]OZC42736.1 phosphotransferase family protein [Rhodococcus fascians]OZE92305.1 phosphotransferase family protein [Rhodococcus fascians]OZF22938.1 phosphotransferase family protein [Rhodococcus fascians]
MSDLPGMNRVALERFLRAEGIDVDGELTVEMISGGRSNLTYKVYDDTSTWVVRRPPTSGLTPSAHDMAREWAVTDALASTAVPVAETVAFDREGDVLGAPMTVVRFVPGRVVRTREDLRDLTDEQVADNAAELVRVLAELHAVDPAAVGLEKFGRPDGFVARQVATWARQWQTVKTRELPDVDRLHRALEAAVPTRSAASIVHGDFRVDNTILDAQDVSSVAAVVDWEMSTLGDPLTDVALMCVYRQPVFDAVLGADAAWTSDRYPSAADLVQQYAVRSGREVDNWGFYVALANFKLGVIGEGITHRALSGSDTGAGARNAAEATGEFIAAGLRALSAG